MTKRPEENLNLVQIYWRCVRRYGMRPALLYKEKGNYRSIPWSQWGEKVKKTALGLYALGVRKGDRVAILSENRPEWTFADLGILSLGAITVPIYPTSSYQEIAYVVEHAEIEIIFVSNQSQFEKLKDLLKRSDKLRWTILFDDLLEYPERVVNLNRLLEIGRREALNNQSLYDFQLDRVSPEDLATIIYTSGTTGPPKGVMLTHHNFVANALGAESYIPLTEKDVALSFLPLSHVFERMAGYYFMAWSGATIAYAESMQTVPEDMLLVRPTVAAGVPRFFEKVYAGILEKVDAAPAVARRIFFWAMNIGRRAGQISIEGKSIPLLLHFKHLLAKWLVLGKIKRGLGGRIRFFISGGAPLAKELAEFLYAAGILVLEGYGLTETSPVISVNRPKHFKFGTVGRILPNVEVKIAEDGEILTKGPCVMKGYYKNEAATQEAIRDGWFHTGDIGCFDEEGFLKITDRKKDIIVTSGGKNISPQNIENLILGDKLFLQVIVVGDQRNYLVALIVPNQAEVLRYADAVHLSHLPLRELLKHPQIYEWVESRLKERTKDLAPYEQIKYFALFDHELTLAAGELTPTLKVKRKVVMEKYRDLIENLYRKGAERVPSPSIKT